MSSTCSMASDVSMLPPLSSVRQDSDWEFDEAIREALGLGIIPEVQLQGIVLKSCHPSLLDHDYIKLELDSENSIATKPSEATTTTYPEEESSELESEATDNDELPKNDRAEECPNKKNPFHVCTAYCEERWTPQLQEGQDETLLVDLDSDTSTATQPSEATTTNILKDNVEKQMAMQTKPKAFKFRKVSTTDGPRPAKSMKTCNKTYPSCTATSTSGQFSEMSIENLRAIGIMKKFPLPKRSKKSNTAPLSSLAATNPKLCQFDAGTKTESTSKSLPSQMKTSVKKESKDRVIYFSLETTGMNRNSYQKQEGVQICCMAAYYNGDMFEAYLTPTKNFQPGATAYNGMKLSRGVLTKNGKKVECAESMGQGLKRFIEWLNNACDDQTGQLILVAHNSTNFHAVVLMKNLRIVGLKLPSKVVFADTMDIMSQVKIKSLGRLQKLTLDASMRFFFNNEGQGGHDANSTTMKLVELANAAARHLGFDNFPKYLMSNPYSIKQTYVIC